MEPTQKRFKILTRSALNGKGWDNRHGCMNQDQFVDVLLKHYMKRYVNHQDSGLEVKVLIDETGDGRFVKMNEKQLATVMAQTMSVAGPEKGLEEMDKKFNETFYDTRPMMIEAGIRQKVAVYADRYPDGSLYIGLKTVVKEGGFEEPWLDVTTRVFGSSLTDYDDGEGEGEGEGFSQDRFVLVKDYSENEGMVNLMVENGVIDPKPVKTMVSGFVEISVYKTTEYFRNSGVIPSPRIYPSPRGR